MAGEEIDPLESVEVSDVVRVSYIQSHLSMLQEIVDRADKIFSGYPREYRENIEDSGIKEFRWTLSNKIAQMHPSIRVDLRKLLNELQLYISEEEGGNRIDLLDETDTEIIAEMVAFVQKVGRRSSRQLLNFLQAANDGERAYLLIEAHSRQSEIRHRYSVSQAVKNEFEIEI